MPAAYLRLRLLLASSLLVVCPCRTYAQGAGSVRGLHDSVDVASLTFSGANGVNTDELRRIIFTRASTCRLPFLIPLCKVTPNQLFTDRRRTTSAALGEDITKIRVYYWQSGFRDARVDTVLTPAKRGTAVAFRVAEGEPIRIGTLRVTQRDTVLSERELADAVMIHAGQPLSLIALDSTLANLKALVWNKGYADARIDTTIPRPDSTHVVPVAITIERRWLTRVGHVEFEGNRYLSDATLQRGVLLEPGALYTRDAVLESQKRLFQSPAIARALVVTPAFGDSIKTLSFAITEAAPHHAEVILGFNTIDFGQAAVEFRHNDLGGARWLRLHAVASNLLAEQLDGRAIFQQSVPRDAGFDGSAFLRPTYQASIVLTQPWIGSARTSAALTGFAGRRSFANVVIDEAYGGTVGIVHELAPRTPLGLNYHLESNRVQASAVYFCADYSICDAGTIRALSNFHRLAPVAVSAWVDRADDLEVPTSGYTALFDAEHASSATGSTYAHNRVAASGAFYYALGGRQHGVISPALPKVFAMHGRAGYVHPLASDREALGVPGPGDGILHPRARFYAGGMQSVRGFAENQLGPTVLQAQRASLLGVGCTGVTIADATCDPTAVPNNQLFPRPTGGSSVIEAGAELRVPLLRQLGGVLFVDGAYVGVAGLGVQTQGRGAVTPGAGFRYRSPLGVIRLDFGLRPVGAKTLPVLVAVTDPLTGEDRIVRLEREKSYSPVSDPSPGAWHSLARRIVVHFAMGQAF